MELISIHHGLNFEEADLIHNLLENHKFTWQNIRSRLHIADPVKDDWILQQFLAGIIPENEAKMVKWRFLRETAFSEIRLVLEEYVLDGQADEKLAKMIGQIRDNEE